MFLAKKILALVLLPPLAPMLMIFLGLLLIRRKPRLGRGMAWGGLLLALLVSSPWSVHELLTSLERIPVPTVKDMKSAQAVVILGGGKRNYAPEYGGETVNWHSLERCRYGARLARQTGLPVLVSGGVPGKGLSEAALMSKSLEEDFNVPVRWTEIRSRDTQENARFSADMLAPAGIRRVVLVTDAVHMSRAVAEFRRVGLEVVPAPTAFLADDSNESGTGSVGDYLPSNNTAFAGGYASHEWLGYLALKLRGIFSGT